MPYTKEITLPEGYTFRRLEKSDYNNNYRETLQVLTTVGEISESKFNDLFENWNALPNIFHPHVITNEQGKVVATGMLFVEKKLIHECASLGHIEDISVAKSEQGKKLGYSMIVGLTKVAQQQECYKVVLDCSPHNVGFYEKCGYGNGGNNMYIKF
ncbi:Glucosamine-phosphate N-acetyltransferase-like protein [Yamadazyma tenuis]|uniref:Glucosamine 6-phosphate N-acetyltransferase n=1 Tax=Candida tenuis (strain ATCC 10573 / BCRC 21748 / CBS 615 / JCM 9827 / NBRC 10315 / NRRL Y-1498 / VKM Y-70) TaxID=590646 RepID=G3B631_CANTC|nr:acyl-CoA N-acyltransferase [Yamadazyma tenuis ATCC 10573]EGV63366.1 acyl-CoA N-acyltransferase [Yamadazyma tenuis ATCC 10573]WEJ96807.1 Glucosamine-phosphate N-acetyltransferase-like protein [Yamadazyma tenuis]